MSDDRELRCVISDLMDQVCDRTAERDALQARIDAAPVATMKQLAHGIVPGDYAVPWDWNQAGRRVALVALEAGE